MKRATIALIFVLVLGAGAGIFYALNSKAAGIDWNPDLEAARRLSKSAGKPMLLYLYTDWCGFCKQMDETTLRDPLITRQMAPGYVWVRLDAEKDPAGQLLHAELGINGYPTIVLYDPEGREIDRMEGYYEAAKFKEIVEFFQSSPTSFGHLRDAAARTPDSLEARYALAEKYLERNDFLEAAKGFAMVIGHDPENRRALTDAAYYYFAFALASGGQPGEAVKQIDELRAKFPDSKFVADASVLQGQILYYGGQSKEALAVLQDYLARFPRHENRHYATQLANEIRAESVPLASSH